MIGAARKDDARRIMDVLPKRMSKYGLTVHPEKTRVVRFSRPRPRTPQPRNGTHPNRRHSTFWDLPITGDNLSEAHGWSNGRRQRADSSEPRALSEWCRIKPALCGQGTTPKARGKTAGPLWVLRDHWQLLLPPGIPGGCTRDLATVAVSATPRRTNAVDRILSSGGADTVLPAPG